MRNIVAVVTITLFVFVHAVPQQQKQKPHFQRGALQEALRRRNVTAAETLIANGANINEIDKHGDVAINIAIEKELTRIIDVMIDGGTLMVNLKDKDGNSPLLKAVFQDRVTVIDRLLPLGANIHLKNNYGNGPLHVASSAGFTHLVRKFLDVGAPIDENNYQKVTALMYAAFQGRIDIAKLLIERGANIHLQSSDNGKLALHMAAQKGFRNIVILLLENGANINVQKYDGSTALMQAAFSGQVEMTRLLIEKGADIDIKRNDTSNALALAVIGGHLNVVRFLVEKGANIHERRDGDGSTPLLLAAFNGFEEIVKFFMNFDNITDVNTKNLAGETPLHVASFNGFEKVVRLLIESGGDIHDKTNNEQTPLSLAVIGGQTNTVKLLIEQGSYINTQDKNGNTPLHLVVIGEYDKIMDILIENKADFHIKNKLWKEPCDLLDERNRTNTKQTVNIRKACETHGKLTVRRDFGGSLAKVGEYPWMAALGYLNLNYNISFDCGSTIVSSRFLLTAAHCTKEQRKPVLARLGIVNLDDEKAVNYQIKKIIRHPNYTSETETNDIALLQVSKLILFTPVIQPANLEMDVRDEDNDVIVIGWGRSELFEKSNELLKAQLKTMPLIECNRTLLDWNREKDIFLPVFRNGISASQYCAYDPNGRNDSCQGDSGGPLQVFRSNTNTWSIIGIVSFGIGCGTTLPSVYTRVAYYFDWITATIGMVDTTNSRITPGNKIDKLSIRSETTSLLDTIRDKNQTAARITRLSSF